MHTAEIEHTHNQADEYKNMVVGKIEKIEKHPNADKLQITQTNIGDETVQIVCGGPNIKEGMLVPVAKIGAEVKWHGGKSNNEKSKNKRHRKPRNDMRRRRNRTTTNPRRNPRHNKPKPKNRRITIKRIQKR